MSIRDYRFLLTVVWASFVLALSFIETPLRFIPEGIARKDVLAIGHLVFHALNYCELVFAALLLISEFSCRVPRQVAGDKGEVSQRNMDTHAGRSSKAARRLLLILAVLLLVQTIMLFTVLDWRTLAIINGQQVPEAMYHVVYIVMELVKLFLLLVLAAQQIRSFKKQCAGLIR